MSFLRICFLFLLVVVICPTYFHAQTSTTDIERKIHFGDIDEASKILEKSISIAKSNKEKALLFKLKGDISKLQGDIDTAYDLWEKSNTYRSKVYSKGDFHLAWSYALLSNYHYEKINTDLAVKYADSCSLLIKNLSIEQQKEIEIFKIWNILAQSYKQKDVRDTELHKEIRDYYKQSEQFILKYGFDSFHLAMTYGLLGNSYTDVVGFSDTKDKDYQTGKMYYAKAIGIIKQLYGSHHYQLGRIYMVQGFLNEYYGNLDEKFKNYELALNAFGYDTRNFHKIHAVNIPNKAIFLMNCKYLTLAYQREYQKTKSAELLTRLEKLNQLTIMFWEEAHKEFTSTNINQNLAIYGLIPFSETIAIEFLKKEAKQSYSIEKVFESVQKLKAYDVVKNNAVITIISIKELQNRLKSNEVFVDFQSGEKLSALKITQQSAEIFELNISVKTIEDFKNSIIHQDYETYTKTALEIYKSIFEFCKLEKYKTVILCLDESLHNLPFDALLCSNKNIDKKDYRLLDYTGKRFTIKTVLNPNLYNDKIFQHSFQINAFHPNPGKEFAVLPFNQKLTEKLKSKHKASVFTGKEASKNQFLSASGGILHLSGHALINDRDVSSSFLHLSDAVVGVEDIYQLSEIPPFLLLNTCNSSIGRVYQGDGVNGFVRASHLKGASTTLSNLWEVDDKLSAELLEDFYYYLSEGYSTYQALHMAKKKSIGKVVNSELAAPYYWAGHQLVGEELIFTKNESKTFSFLWIIGVVLVAGVIVTWLKYK